MTIYSDKCVTDYLGYILNPRLWIRGIFFYNNFSFKRTRHSCVTDSETC